MSAASVPYPAPSFVERLILRIAEATAAGIRERVERRAERRRSDLDRLRERQARGGYDPVEAERIRWLIDAGLH